MRCRKSSLPSAVWHRRRDSTIFPRAMADREPTSTGEVAARLRLTREALSLSQAALCRLTGIPTNTWNNAETADNRLGLDEAIKLCRATGVSLDWIYRGVRVNLPEIVAVEVIRRENPTNPTKKRA